MIDNDERDESDTGEGSREKRDQETLRAELNDLKARLAVLRQRVEDLESKL